MEKTVLDVFLDLVSRLWQRFVGYLKSNKNKASIGGGQGEE